MKKAATSRVGKTRDLVGRKGAKEAVRFVEHGEAKFDMFGKDGCLGSVTSIRMGFDTCNLCKNFNVLTKKCLVFEPQRHI